MVDFNTLKSTPFVWQNAARELICAANVLLNYVDSPVARPPRPSKQGLITLWRPMMVLYALAAENLVKAVIISRGIDPAPGGTLESWFKSHDLEKLFLRAKVSFNADSEFLRKLRDFIEAGKYPIGKDALSGAKSKSLSIPGDINSVFALLEKLEDELRTAVPRKSLPKMNLREIVPFSET